MVLISFLILSQLTSCATLDQSECKSANWEIIGLEDGSNGRYPSYIGKHRKACADYGIAPDLKAYLRGHQSGLREFCTEQNGYERALSGHANKNICPAELSNSFNRGYQKGYQLYLLQSKIDKLKANIDSHLHRLDDIENTKIAIEEEIIDNSTGEVRRRALLKEIKALERETESLYHELDEMKLILSRLQDKFHSRHR